MQDPEFVHEAFSAIAPRYVVTNHVLSLGIDVLWREKVARLVSDRDPASILDVATGSGDLAAAVLRRCPGARMVATDFCDPMLEHARKRGLPEVAVADAMDLPFEDAEFDAVTVGFGLRNMSSYPGAIAEMGRVVSKTGTLAVLDFSLPDPPLSWIYRPYLRWILPTVGGWITGQRAAYEYLCGSIHQFPSGREMTLMIEENGFRNCRAIPLCGGIASIYLATK